MSENDEKKNLISNENFNNNNIEEDIINSINNFNNFDSSIDEIKNNELEMTNNNNI